MILDGKKIATNIKLSLKHEIEKLTNKPKMVVLLVGENPASLAYIRQKRRACEEVGIEFELRQYDVSINEAELLGVIHELNNNTEVSGYIIQLPLPAHIHEKIINNAIDPHKDIDGFTPENIGGLALGTNEKLIACTPKGIMRLLKEYAINVAGKHVVIIGRSNIVGKPLAIMCINAGATVTVCNSQTRNIPNHTKNADIIVCAAGKPGLLKQDMVTPGSIIIDVGINRVGDLLVGDADYADLEPTNTITPVPGGIGPMTVAMLLENTYLAHIQK